MKNLDLEAIREHAEVNAGMDDELLFYASARALGYDEMEAEWADMLLTQRVMQARGAI